MYINQIMYKHIINTTDRQHRQTLIQHMIQINSTITYKHINNYFPLQIQFNAMKNENFTARHSGIKKLLQVVFTELEICSVQPSVLFL